MSENSKTRNLFQDEYEELDNIRKSDDKDLEEQTNHLIDIAGSIVACCSPPKRDGYLKKNKNFHHQIQEFFNYWKLNARKVLGGHDFLKDEFEIIDEADKVSLLFDIVQKPWYDEKKKAMKRVELVREAASKKRKVLQDARTKIQEKGAFSPKRTSLNIPSGTTWGDLIIDFKNKHNAEIKLKEKSNVVNYKEMGFEDSRTGKPNQQWGLLLVLSKKHGEIKPEDPESKDNYKKQKQLLKDQLQEYFQIDYDPFHPYEKNNSYKIKITLLPPDNSQMDDDNKPKGTESMLDPTQ